MALRRSRLDDVGALRLRRSWSTSSGVIRLLPFESLLCLLRPLHNLSFERLEHVEVLLLARSGQLTDDWPEDVTAIGTTLRSVALLVVVLEIALLVVVLEKKTVRQGIFINYANETKSWLVPKDSFKLAEARPFLVQKQD